MTITIATPSGTREFDSTDKAIEYLKSRDEEELRLRVLRGEYEPENGDRFDVIDGATGRLIISSRVATSDTSARHLFGKDAVFAPPKFSEELSAVIKGEYVPTEEDSDARVPFYTYDKIKKDRALTNVDMWTVKTML